MDDAVVREVVSLGGAPEYLAEVCSRWGETVVSRGRVHVLADLPALLAERDGRPVGCLAFVCDAGAVEVVTLDAFEPGRGIGRALFIAAAAKGERIWLVTTNDNAAAQRFYSAMGMTLVAVHRGAVDRARVLKPGIPLVGVGGVSIEDEFEYDGWPDVGRGEAVRRRFGEPGTCSLRRLAGDDWQLYRHLRIRALGDAPEAFSSTLDEALLRSEAEWAERLADADPLFDCPMLAEVDGFPVGLVWGRIEPVDRAVGHIYQMWVVPESRGLGVGRRLLAAVLDWAASAGATTVRLGVTRGNRAAFELYRSAGFLTTGATQALRPGSDRVVDSMELRLIGSGGT